MLNEFTYHELFNEQIIMKNEIIYFSDIEKEIKKHIKNIEISFHKEYGPISNKLYVIGTFRDCSCMAELKKITLITYYEKYLEKTAYYIKDLISKRFFERNKED